MTRANSMWPWIPGSGYLNQLTFFILLFLSKSIVLNPPPGLPEKRVRGTGLVLQTVF